MKFVPNRNRRTLLALALALAVPVALLAASGSPVTEALKRPAIVAKHGERAVLLGAASAGDRLVVVGERGLVLASTDGGASWQQQAVPVSTTLTAVRFADAKHGVVVGHAGSVLLTKDGGKTWALALDGRKAAGLALQAAQAAAAAAPAQKEASAVTPQAAQAEGEYVEEVVPEKSPADRVLADAQRLVDDGPDKPFLDVLVQDANRIVVVGAYGLIFASEDSGRSWKSWMSRIDNPRGQYFYAIRQRGDEIVIAGEQGLVLRSGDGGITFQRIEVPYKGSFFALELPGERDIVVAGLRGNAWQSHDGGATWAQVQNDINASITSSIQLADGTLLFGDQAGRVLRLDGDRLAPVNAAPLPPVNALASADGKQTFALTLQGVVALK